MTDHETFSFVYDRAAAAEVFQEIGTQGLMLAMLARLEPSPKWEGCLVYKGEAPEGNARMVCIAMRGPAAMEVQERLVEVFEATGIAIPAIYEGGPEPQLEIARVRGGRWTEP
jgi:hypothetical protein